MGAAAADGSEESEEIEESEVESSGDEENSDSDVSVDDKANRVNELADELEGQILQQKEY